VEACNAYTVICGVQKPVCEPEPQPEPSTALIRSAIPGPKLKRRTKIGVGNKMNMVVRTLVIGVIGTCYTQ